MNATSFHELLVREAETEGFPLAGAVDVDLALTADGRFAEHLRKYDAWLAGGFHGTMEYLNRGRDRRADPRVVLPSARAVFSVAIPYRRSPAGENPGSEGVRYARYIDGADYHDVIAEKLERVMRRVKECAQDAGLRWKVCVDTSAVLERAWAALAGLGWIGKNTLLIHPKLGSYLFLGEVLINRATGMGPRPMAELCGHCDRCLSACPTSAFLGPRSLDSRRCISYWTLEKRGEISLPESEKSRFGPWIAGCDLCQEACPFNLKPSRRPDADRDRCASDLRTWDGLLGETSGSYRERVKDSALSRVKPGQFSRNLAIALRNSLDAVPEELGPRIAERAANETDPFAKAEWLLTLSRFESRKRPPDTTSRTGI